MGVSISKPIGWKMVNEDFVFSIEKFQRIPLVSFEQAVEPLISVLPTIKTYIQLVKEKWHDPINGLTADESASIMLYSIQWQPYDQCLHAMVNFILSESSIHKYEPWLYYFKLLFTALSHLPSIHSIIYRGSKLDLSKHYHLEEVILWKDLPLCTTSMSDLRSETCLDEHELRTVFKIESSNVKDIRECCYSSENTFAVVLPATKFQIVDCYYSTNDHLYWIVLKEIQPSLFLHSIDQTKSTPFHKFWFSLIHSRNSSLIIDNIYRNIALEHRIVQYGHSWTIDLGKQNLTDRDMNIVVKHALIKNRCKRVRLCDNNITCQGLSILSKGLNNNSTLESIDLRNNQISDFGIQCLTAAIVNSNIKTLNLESNQITHIGAQYLAQLLKENRTITELYLSKNHLGDRGIELIANALMNASESLSEQTNKQICARYSSTLQHLYLGQNDITDVGLKYLSNMLKSNRTLTWLWLTGNEISDHGVEILSNTLANSNTNIEWLFLNSNSSITDGSVDVLLNMFKRNFTLKTLYINNCNLSDVGKRKLLKMIKTKKDFDLEV
ncbi:unnamed protein product [Adineta ricciae]|uniref:Uncharacterized protein n=1 Tax=Adineta ricciae TaxID=249248 RepID=A0A814RQY3_ADIRI|nr:unnamed protein product [Adineta ricciae]